MRTTRRKRASVTYYRPRGSRPRSGAQGRLAGRPERVLVSVALIMTRATRFATLAGCLSFVYLVFFLGILPVPFLSQETAQAILPTVCGLLLCMILTLQLPWWALISIGAYLMYQVGWGLYNFNDTPKAYDELLMVRKRMKVLYLHGVTGY